MNNENEEIEEIKNIQKLLKKEKNHFLKYHIKN